MTQKEIAYEKQSDRAGIHTARLRKRRSICGRQQHIFFSPARAGRPFGIRFEVLPDLHFQRTEPGAGSQRNKLLPGFRKIDFFGGSGGAQRGRQVFMQVIRQFLRRFSGILVQIRHDLRFSGLGLVRLL